MMDNKTIKRIRHPYTAAAFTLVEMVIVIGVIILLAALTLAVSVAVVEGSEVRQTESTIQLLDTAMREWEALADRKIQYGAVGEPFPGASYEVEQSPDADLDAAV
jgi:type II secretory pathway pseudopilin PulG